MHKTLDILGEMVYPILKSLHDMQENGGDKMNLPMLKGKLYERKKTYKDLAQVLGLSVTSVNDKMNGRSDFDCAEACIIKGWVPLTDQESIEIFLT